MYVFDRGYLDCSRLYRIRQSGAFFVTGAKSHNRFQRRYSIPVDKVQGIVFAHTARWKSYYPSRHYPDTIRRTGYRDPATERKLVFLTNHHLARALSITDTFKSRWRIELFFKWIKQHFRIKAFYGTSENPVRVQIWVAMSVYVLIAIIRKMIGLIHSPYTILRILSVTLFQNTPLLQIFSLQPPAEDSLSESEQ
jgi:hypothetical protein